mmetsp:Transcript_12625/g.30809  ORF Transcript_12625/g.30809 Transcript_12625/m.30809 type:complete len:351 (-) Transcript_12625:541-1593(-)
MTRTKQAKLPIETPNGMLLPSRQPHSILLIRRNPSHHQIHGGEDAQFSSSRQAHAAALKQDLRPAGSRGRQSEEFHHLQRVLGEEEAEAVELEPLRERIPGGHQRKHPWLASAMVLASLLARRIRSGGARLPTSIIIVHQIPLLQNLEPRLLQRRQAVMRRRDVREPISLLDLLLDRYVLGIVGIVLVRQAPLVAGEDCAGPEYAVDLRVASDAIRRVARRLDGVGRVEARRFERLLHEVSLDRTTANIRESIVVVVLEVCIGVTELVAPVDLILIQSQSRDVGPSELADVAHGTPDAASHIEDFHACHGGRAPLLHHITILVCDVRSVHLLPHPVADPPQRAAKIELSR